MGLKKFAPVIVTAHASTAEMAKKVVVTLAFSFN